MTSQAPGAEFPDTARGRNDGPSSAKAFTVALAGNPNSGKTTVFNAITGARQRVGNYPGVTVEKKQGAATHGGRKLHIVDLPGTYSLTPTSADELVARNFLLEGNADVVVDVIDSSNLERNLYLATLLVEMDVPLVLAFNMADVARNRGMAIDESRLSELLGLPIVSVVGHKGRGDSEASGETAAPHREYLRRRHGDHSRRPAVRVHLRRVQRGHPANGGGSPCLHRSNRQRVDEPVAWAADLRLDDVRGVLGDVHAGRAADGVDRVGLWHAGRLDPAPVAPRQR